MSLSILQAGPAIMYGGLAFGLGFGSFVHQKEPSWKIPAMVCAGFWGFTAFTVDQEGLF
ncbi:unnamed protein product, partial [Cylindrotheca closterium]